MKNIALLVTVVTLFSLVLTAEIDAQRGRGRNAAGWGPGTPYGRMYNPQTVETVSGEVVSVDRITPFSGMSAGIHIGLRTENEAISVHIGPAWYIEKQDMDIKRGDSMEIKGSRITYEGEPTIIAAQLKKAENRLTLRDERGIPVWSGWRRR